MTIRRRVKRFAVSLPGFGAVARQLTRKINPKVFVYHRFCDASDDSEHKMDAVTFGHHLDEIMTRYRVVSFGHYLTMAARGEKIPAHLAVITIDDGYRDFYRFAFPELKKRGLEATFFVTVNFINRKVWLWPDRLDYALKTTHFKALDMTFQELHLRLPLASEGQRECALRVLIDTCISLQNEEKWRLIRAVESHLGVDVQDPIPDLYEPVTWDELREMAGQGVEIGCHTMNHPILSKVLPDELQGEIGASKAAIEERLGVSVKSFCYPNSAPGDINEMVVAHVRRAGYMGAVFGVSPHFSYPFQIPRISLDRDISESHWKIGGMEMLLPTILV